MNPKEHHASTNARHADRFGGGEILDMGTIEALRQLGGDDDAEFLLELIDLFVDDATIRIQTMCAALPVGDLESVGAAAHALKSASANVGAGGLSALCKRLESEARRPTGEPMADLVEQTKGMFSEVESALGEVKSRWS